LLHSCAIRRLAVVHARLSHAVVRMVVKHGLMVHVRLHAQGDRTRLCVHVTAPLQQRITAVLPVGNGVLLLLKQI
jgi:hypothetical protein